MKQLLRKIFNKKNLLTLVLVGVLVPVSFDLILTNYTAEPASFLLTAHAQSGFRPVDAQTAFDSAKARLEKAQSAYNANPNDPAAKEEYNKASDAYLSAASQLDFNQKAAAAKASSGTCTAFNLSISACVEGFFIHLAEIIFGIVIK